MSTMQAAYINHYGSSEKIVFGNLNVPAIGESDVLVEIFSASLNPIDYKIRDGKLKFLRSYSFPLILGHDLAGVVSEVGPQVTKFKKGDKVYSRPRNGRTGSLAEYIAIDENEIALMPQNISFSEAASIPLIGLTSWQALIDVAKIKSGDRVFIQAGSGGVGSFAIQLAKHLGAYVMTSTSTRNVEFVQGLGADEVVDYKNQNFEEILKNVDIVFDTLGGQELYKAFRIVNSKGSLVSISGDPDHKLAKEMNLNIFKTWVLWLIGYKANRLAKKANAHYHFIFMKSNGHQLSQITKLIEGGKIKPVIDREFSFEESQQAIEYLEAGRARGKVVIKLRDENRGTNLLFDERHSDRGAFHSFCQKSYRGCKSGSIQ